MASYVARRLFLAVPTLLLVTVLVFSVIRLVPGDVVSIMTANIPMSEPDIQRLREQLGLDRPLHVQYLSWIGDIFRGEMGRSLWTNKPVVRDLLQRLPVTLELSFLAVVFSLIMGIPIGILAAVRQDSWADYIARSIAITGLAVPGFWLATMTMVGLSVWFGWMPPIRYVDLWVNPIENLRQLFLPAVVLAVNMAASVMRMTRTTLLEVLRQDYIRTAWAKGLWERLVIQRHALRNAFGPVVTIIGVNIAVVLGGSVIMEQIFVIPGMGSYMIQSVLFRDYPALQALNIFLAVPIIFINILTDIFVGYLDPRIRYK